MEEARQPQTQQPEKFNEPSRQQIQQQQPQSASADPYRVGYDQPGMRGNPTNINMTHVSVNQQMGRGDAADGLRNWSTSICGCCDDMVSCCLVCWFCPCYMCCCMSHRMGESCCAPFCLLLSGQSSPLVYRTKIRATHGIRGGAIDDCCVTTGCCMTCAVCQLKRELDFIERTTGTPAFVRS